MTGAMHAAWQSMKTDTRDAQLRKTVKKLCNWLKRVRSAAVVRFFERHDVELETQLHMADQLPKHQIGAAGGDEEGRITVHP